MKKHYSWHRDSKYRYLLQEIRVAGWKGVTGVHWASEWQGQHSEGSEKKTSKGDFPGEAVIELSQEWDHGVNGILKCPEFLWALLCSSAEYPLCSAPITCQCKTLTHWKNHIGTSANSVLFLHYPGLLLLNKCFCPLQIHMLKLITNVMVLEDRALGKWLGDEGKALMHGTHDLAQNTYLPLPSNENIPIRFMNQEAGSLQTSNLLASWSWTSQLPEL